MANEAYNLSARGVEITISLEKGDIITITDFADDADPISIDDVDIGDVSFDINGKIFQKKKLVPCTCHVAVIPGSESEKKLNKLVLNNMPILGKGEKIANLSVTFPYKGDENDIDFVFYNGYILGASVGYATTSQGRIKTKEFSFAFQSCGQQPGAPFL